MSINPPGRAQMLPETERSDPQKPGSLPFSRYWFPAGVPLAWRQLCYDRNRLAAAICGIVLAVTSILFQTGTFNALFESVAAPFRAMNADLMIHSADFKYMVMHVLFSRDKIASALGDPDVASGEGINVGLCLWKSPDTGRSDDVLVFAIDPACTAFHIEEIRQNRAWLTFSDALLYDRLSVPEYGDVEGRLRRGEPCSVEINGFRCQVRGLFSLGISFTADAQAVMSKAAYNRISPGTPDYAVSLGLIRLRPGADRKQVRDRLRRRLGQEVVVLTKEQIIEAEKAYWNERTPIGFIIPMTLLVVILVGAIVFYQILYTDVQHHLPEYATLKAIGFRDRDLERIVVQQAVCLSVLGYPPGLLLAFVLFHLAKKATHLPFELTLGQAVLAFVLTFAMCLAAGMVAMRKLRHAQPADVFA